MKFKNFTYKMTKELSKRLKDVNLSEWGYSKNTPEFIELINRSTGERMKVNKNEYRISSF